MTRFEGEPIGDGEPGPWTARARADREAFIGDAAAHRPGRSDPRELITRTRQLVVEGDRLVANPSLDGLRTWLQLSDDLLSTAWGRMDRYHLAWLQVGRPKDIVRGRPMTHEEADAYVREVARRRRRSCG